MSSTQPDLSRTELAALVADLEERVTDLETTIQELTEAEDDDAGGGASEYPGLDHRDQSVLDEMAKTGKRSKRRLVKLYTQFTDIQDQTTAKRRAKRLEQHPAYEELDA